MRINFIYGSLILIFVLCSCATKTEHVSADQERVNDEANLTPEISFTMLTNDMGMIREGEQVITWFDYQNKGNAPLIIQDIKAGCGCTVPSWNKSPLAPGKEETIKVIFDSWGKSGVQNIKITVHSNAVNSIEELHINALVESIN